MKLAASRKTALLFLFSQFQSFVFSYHRWLAYRKKSFRDERRNKERTFRIQYAPCTSRHEEFFSCSFHFLSTQLRGLKMRFARFTCFQKVHLRQAQERTETQSVSQLKSNEFEIVQDEALKRSNAKEPSQQWAYWTAIYKNEFAISFTSVEKSPVTWRKCGVPEACISPNFAHGLKLHYGWRNVGW